MNRWTKYAKSGFYIEKTESENETLKAHAAPLSRKTTSLALKCSVSKPLLDDLEKALDKLDLEADDSLNKMRENDVPLVSNNCGNDKINGSISFRVPQVVKGAKNKRAKSVVEKKTGKKKKTSQKKGEEISIMEEHGDGGVDPNQLTGVKAGSISTIAPTLANDLYGQSLTIAVPLIRGSYDNVTMTTFINDLHGQPSTMDAPLIQGGYTNLILGVQQDATLSSAARKLHFHE
ncbi:hypothetical protein BS78_02G239500 [Paspalum vaginatum]|nr:hypothetical protein BS78_02G239500 [Paspalum vaginatum]